MARVLFFGRLSDASDALDINLPATVKTTDDLKVWLGEQRPALKTILNHNGNKIAVNKVMIHACVDITDTDEIAFMSPLSGG